MTVIPAQETPYRTREIRVESATEAVGYGYVMYASRTDWSEIAAARGEDENGYLTTTVAHYPEEDHGELVGIHVDAAELTEIWEAIAKLDLASVGETVPQPRIDTQPYEAYNGAEETVRLAYYQRGNHQYLLEYYDACAATYRIRLLERDDSEWDEVATYEPGQDAAVDTRLIAAVRASVYAAVIEDCDDEELIEDPSEFVGALYALWTDDFDACLGELGVVPAP